MEDGHGIHISDGIFEISRPCLNHLEFFGMCNYKMEEVGIFVILFSLCAYMRACDRACAYVYLYTCWCVLVCVLVCALVCVCLCACERVMCLFLRVWLCARV